MWWWPVRLWLKIHRLWSWRKSQSDQAYLQEMNLDAYSWKTAPPMVSHLAVGAMVTKQRGRIKVTLGLLRAEGPSTYTHLVGEWVSTTRKGEPTLLPNLKKRGKDRRSATIYSPSTESPLAQTRLVELQDEAEQWRIQSLQILHGHLTDYIQEELKALDVTDPTSTSVMPVLLKMCEERHEVEEALEQAHRSHEKEIQEEFLVTRTVGTAEVQRELEMWRPAIEKDRPRWSRRLKQWSRLPEPSCDSCLRREIRQWRSFRRKWFIRGKLGPDYDELEQWKLSNLGGGGFDIRWWSGRRHGPNGVEVGGSRPGHQNSFLECSENNFGYHCHGDPRYHEAVKAGELRACMVDCGSTLPFDYITSGLASMQRFKVAGNTVATAGWIRSFERMLDEKNPGRQSLVGYNRNGIGLHGWLSVPKTHRGSGEGGESSVRYMDVLYTNLCLQWVDSAGLWAGVAGPMASGEVFASDSVGGTEDDASNRWRELYYGGALDVVLSWHFQYMWWQSMRWRNQSWQLQMGIALSGTSDLNRVAWADLCWGRLEQGMGAKITVACQKAQLLMTCRTHRHRRGGNLRAEWRYTWQRQLLPAWMASSQPLVTQSTAEAELVGLSGANLCGQSVHGLLEVMLELNEGENNLEVIMYGDNSASISMASGNSRASYLRQSWETEGWLLRHLRGTELVADGLTIRT